MPSLEQGLVHYFHDIADVLRDEAARGQAASGEA